MGRAGPGAGAGRQTPGAGRPGRGRPGRGRPVALLLWASIAGAAAPGRAEDPPAAEPDQLRDLVAVQVADLEGAAATTSGGGLKLSALFLPDAFSFRVAKEYLRRREAGESHQAALRGTALLLPSLKQREGMAAVRLRIENQNPRPGGQTLPGVTVRRIFILQKIFAGDAASLVGPRGKPLPVRLAEQPLHLRPAQIRDKKFWTTADGATRRRAYDPDDPSSIGRKPLLSKPRPALLIEEKPVEAELLFKAKALGEGGLPRLRLSGLERFQGPFENDQLDLNGGRQKEPVEALELGLKLPPGGLEPPRALARLLEEVRASVSR